MAEKSLCFLDCHEWVYTQSWYIYRFQKYRKFKCKYCKAVTHTASDIELLDSDPIVIPSEWNKDAETNDSKR